MPKALPSDDSEERVLAILNKIPGKKYKAHQLAALIHEPDTSVRDIVRTLRLKGHLVCSDTDGFYASISKEDAQETSRHLWSRVRALVDVARAHDAAMEERWGITFKSEDQVELAFGREGE